MKARCPIPEPKAYLDPEEVEKLIAAACTLRDRLLIRVLSRLGCRISEALALKVEDINFVQGTVIIEHLKARVRLSCPRCNAGLGRTHAFCPKCGARVEEAQAREQKHRRMRTLPIDKETLNMLRDYVGQGDQATKNGRNLFFGIGRGQAWRVVREAARRAGLPPMVNPATGRALGASPHRLRDAFAVHAVKVDDSGDGLRLLQEHLGHASFNTTARYRKVSGREHREWYRKLCGQLPARDAPDSGEG
ncbi:MAG: tyrosine-type recombinase/integrase [Chloroflexota bacterium]